MKVALGVRPRCGPERLAAYRWDHGPEYRPATPGDRVRLRFRLGPDCAEMGVEAEVVWCIEAAGGTRFCQLGLHFLDLRDEQRSEIATLVADGNAPPP